MDIEGSRVLIGDGQSNNTYEVTCYTVNEDGQIVTTNEVATLTMHFGVHFGAKVLLHGDYAFVTAIDLAIDETSSGSIYVFRYHNNAWELTQTLTASDDQDGDLFGISIAADSDTLVIGAPRNFSSVVDGGAVYVFELIGDMWQESTKIFPDDLSIGDQFGVSVAVESDTLVVGAWRSDKIHVDGGGAYVFSRDQGIWSQRTFLSAESSGEDYAGLSVAMSGNVIAMGAYNQTVGDRRNGAIQLFTKQDDYWRNRSHFL